MATDFKELIKHKDFDTLMNEAREDMKGGTVTNWNVGGVFRTMVALCMTVIAQFYDLLVEKILPNCFVAYAKGRWLDLICRDVDLERHWAEKAEGVITFARDDPTGSIKIEAGSIVKTQTTANGDELRFFVVADTMLEAGSNEVDVPVAAEFTGAAYNVSEGAVNTLVTHINGIDRVSNKASWLNKEGSNDEEDDSLRDRYYLRWNELSTGSTALAYKSWAMRVSGVLDAAVNDMHPRGQGTVDVIITSADGDPTQALIDDVAAFIATKRPQCSEVLVKAPRPVSLDIDVQLWLPNNEGDDDIIIATAQEVIKAMFVPDTKYREIPIQKIGNPFYKARLNRWLMDIEHVFNVVINMPTEDTTIEYDQLIERNNVNISILRVAT